MSRTNLFLAALLTLITVSSGTLFAYSGGDGTAGNPYQIANFADLQQLSATSGDLSKSFILTADINLVGLTFTQSPIAPATRSNFGLQGTPFTGIFDGNSHTISNLAIHVADKEEIDPFCRKMYGKLY